MAQKRSIRKISVVLPICSGLDVYKNLVSAVALHAVHNDWWSLPAPVTREA
ncbi:MAG: hypothetical protein ABFS43_08955 [Thermodesulfobacteriota bacterium]